MQLSKEYLVYVVLVLAACLVLSLIVYGIHKSKGTSRSASGWFLLGPAHLLLRQRDYRFTGREIAGWVVVLALMLLAPLISHWLE